MNIVLLIGRLVSDVEIKELPNKVSAAYITLAVKRDFKNSNGEYETDFIPVTLWEGLAQSISQYCHKGTLVSLKGRIAMYKKEMPDGRFFNYTDIIGEKVMVLSQPLEKAD